jgi:hypothetical protein
MTALQTPAQDAPAAEWGSLAERIPGWADLPGDRSGPHRMPRIGPQNAPDPDHWAWEGWLLRLLGRPVELKLYHGVTIRWYPRIGCSLSEGVTGRGSTTGRACIAAAAKNGRWPGGEL